MEKLLPGKARYKTTVIQSPQSKLAEMKKESGSAQAKHRQQEQDELNSRPEVQAQIAEYLRQHYRKWPEEKLPALNGKTPLQAVKTRDGKEMVEALLMEIERGTRSSNMPLPDDLITSLIDELRERLGLGLDNLR